MPIPGKRRSRFWTGIARLADMTAALHREPQLDADAWRALSADGAAIMGDMWRAVERADEETSVTPEQAAQRSGELVPAE